MRYSFDIIDGSGEGASSARHWRSASPPPSWSRGSSPCCGAAIAAILLTPDTLLRVIGSGFLLAPNPNCLLTLNWVQPVRFATSFRRRELPKQPGRRDPERPPPFAELLEGSQLGLLDEIGDERVDAGSHGVRVRHDCQREAVMLGPGLSNSRARKRSSVWRSA